MVHLVARTPSVPGGVTAARLTLDQLVEVRILAGQPWTQDRLPNLGKTPSGSGALPFRAAPEASGPRYDAADLRKEARSSPIAPLMRHEHDTMGAKRRKASRARHASGPYAEIPNAEEGDGMPELTQDMKDMISSQQCFIGTTSKGGLHPYVDRPMERRPQTVRVAQDRR